MTHGYLVDIVLMDDDVERTARLSAMMQAWLANPQGDDQGGHPDVVLWWYVHHDAAEELERARREGRVEVNGKQVPTTLELDDVAYMLGVMPGRVDLHPDGHQVQVRVAGQVVTVTPRRLSIMPQSPTGRWSSPAARPTLWLPDTAVRVMPYRPATQDEKRLLRDRASDEPTFTAPTAMAAALNGATTAAPKAKDRRLRVSSHEVILKNKPTGEPDGKMVVVTLRHGHQLLLEGSTVTRTKDGDDVAKAIMEQAARHLDDGIMRVFLTLCCLRDASGCITTNYEELARLQGLNPKALDAGQSPIRHRHGVEAKRVPTLRARLKRDLDTLMGYVWNVSWKLKLKENEYLEGPLVVPIMTRGTESNGRRRETHVVVQLNPAIFGPLSAAGLMTAMDPRLLRLSAHAMRIGTYMAARMAPSFATQKLDQKGGRIEVRVATLLEQTGKDWADLVADRGKGPARQKVKAWLNELETAPDGGPIAWVKYVEADDVMDDQVVYQPGVHVFERQMASSSKRLGARDRADNARTQAHVSTRGHAGTLSGGTT